MQVCCKNGPILPTNAYVACNLESTVKLLKYVQNNITEKQFCYSSSILTFCREATDHLFFVNKRLYWALVFSGGKNTDWDFSEHPVAMS